MEAKVKVRVIKKYNDPALKKIQTAGTEFETSEQRARYLVSQGMVEIVGEKTERKEQKKDEREQTVS